MHAATVELLVQKAQLDPDTALAIATAIDMALQNAQLVTVPVLDARFAAFEARMDARFAASNAEIKAEMKAGFALSEANWSVALEKTEAEVRPLGLPRPARQRRTLPRREFVAERPPTSAVISRMTCWRTPDGAKVAWFQDPDGNTRSLTQWPN